MHISKRTQILLLFILPALLFLLADHYVDINIAGDFEGFYLTRNKTSKVYEFSDHLVVGKEKSIIYAFNLVDSYQHMAQRLFPKHGDKSNHLYCEWNPWEGSGLVSSYFADGTGLVTYLGRYLDDEKEVHGLFVGGGIPETIENSNNYNMNNSGMTYFDGKRWYHVWCSVNEGIASAVTGKSFTPSKWEFIGSGVESRSNEKVVLTSSHKLTLDKVPLRIDRKMHFTAGETYFTLEITITNIGSAAVLYSYMYGDEPWVGFYGTSLGDVGWVKDRIVSYEEMIDPSTHTYIGMADIGNRVINEQPIYTNLANFLEWFGPERPTNMYFTNDLRHLPSPGKKMPLESNERFIGMQWERRLLPSESSTIRLAIGMASLNPRTGIPEKPETSWK